jgi:carbonic anhydrase/acetyltransferase-like protein (isoleucine patch superfamily)
VSAPPGAWQARLEIDKDAWIAPGAVVVGSVKIGARASVWFNTVVRGDTDRVEIGDDSNVQDNSTVHVDEGQPALIGARVTVGHRAIVHGCVIEDECLIGMGSVILSGARIGTGSLIGAASLVREGQDVPPRSLALGSPARVVGPVSDAHRDAIRRGSAHYVELSRSYRERGLARPHPWIDSSAGVTSLALGPVTSLEWAALLETLAAGPPWAAALLASTPPGAWERAPGDGRWSARDVLAHLRDVEVRVALPRARRILLDGASEVPDVNVQADVAAAGGAPESAARLLAEWRSTRAALLDLLRPCVPREWRRPVTHSKRGPFSLGEMVRGLVEHELAHRRQLERALAAAP